MTTDERVGRAEAAGDPIRRIDDWSAWHGAYADPDSELNGRKRAVQAQVARIVDESAPGPVTIVSVCGGQGREVIEALAGHPRRGDVRGRIVELDSANVAHARASAAAAGLDRLEVVAGDASLSDAYAGLPPADIVVMSGVVGHLSSADRVRLIDFYRQLCRPGGSVVWTSYRGDEAALEEVRACFADAGFEEVVLETLPGRYRFVVARSRFAGAPVALQPGVKLFTFGSSRMQTAAD